MPTYAVLGATGNTGSSILQILLQSPSNTIHAYARSSSKLLTLVPALADHPRVQVFEGGLQDGATIRSCIMGARAVFLAVALNDNAPGCRIAQDTAHVVIDALKDIRAADPTARMPRLVVLSSASLSQHLSRDIPGIFQTLMHLAASNIYADLAVAEDFLRAQSSWVSTTFIKPGGLVHDAQKGHALSTERQQTFLSFLDLAAGMVEVAAEEGERWDMKDVAVVPTAGDVRVEWRVPYFVLLGLLTHFFPGLYPYLKS